MEKLAIGIDLGATEIKGALVDETGKFIDQRNEPTPATKGRESVIDKICLVIDNLIPKNKEILGIGIGTPGIVDPKTGNIIGASPNIIDWPGTPLGSILKNHYKLPVEVDNDVNTTTLGELHFGNVTSVRDLACIVIGTGVGIGIVLNGEIFRKAHELGHMIVKFDGPMCKCGRQGCVEAFISGTGISNNYYRLTEETISAKMIFNKSQDNDPNAMKVVDDFVNAFGSAMANIVLSFFITDFIITGGVARSLDVFQDRLLSEAGKRSISPLSDQIKIKQGNKHSGILGASSLIFRKRH